MRALLIKNPHIGKILNGKKIWEMRGTRTKIRETICLVESGSGVITGVCNLVNCRGPITETEYKDNARKAGHTREEAALGHYEKTFARVLKNPKRLKKPVPYVHLPGAIIWVTLSPSVERAITRQLAEL